MADIPVVLLAGRCASCAFLVRTFAFKVSHLNGSRPSPVAFPQSALRLQWRHRDGLSPSSPECVVPFLLAPLLKKCCPRIVLEHPADGYERRKGDPRCAGFRVLIDEHLAAVHNP